MITARERRIKSKSWKKYTERLKSLSDKASDEMKGYILAGHTEEEILDVAYALVTKYGEASSELACQMYEALAEYAGARVAAAEPAATATYYETAKSIRGTMMRTKDAVAISSSAGRLVKLASVDTMMKNALRDGAEWAWIPSGDTCAYCLMLASRGWVKASEDAIRNGHADHIHNNCDCTYCVRFDHKTTVEGYDPDALYDQYINAGDTKWERINALRRQHYAANRDYINAQKRAAYARLTGASKAREVSRAREISTLDELKNVSKSSIINMQSKEEIKSYFKDTHNILIEGFNAKDIDKIKILLAGYDDTIGLMPDAGEFIKIIRFDPKLKDYGRMSEKGVSRIGPKGLGSYGTGIHETVHAVDYYRSDFDTHSFADRIIKDATKRLGLRRNGRDYGILAYECTGDIDDSKKTFELLAYAIETELGGGRGNILSKAVYERMMEVL